MLALVHKSCDETVLYDVKDFDCLFLCHPTVKLRYEEVLELDEGSWSFHSFHDLVHASNPEIRGKVALEFHENVNCFIELLLTHTKAEEFKS